MIIPLIAGAFFLGRSFDAARMLSDHYIFDNDVVEQNTVVIHRPFTRSEYKLVDSSSDVTDFLDVKGELSLKVKNNDLNLEGNGLYLKSVIDREKTVELLLTVYHETLTETFPTYLKSRSDWKSRPQSEVGTHYIRSIIYGGQLVISYQMTTSSSENIEQIKASVNAHLQNSGSLNGDVKGKLDKIEKELSGKTRISIFVSATTNVTDQPFNLNDTFRLIDAYPGMVMNAKGKGNPLKLELVPLSTLNPNYESIFKRKVYNEIINEALNKFDDLLLAVSKLRAWSERIPEELKREWEDYGKRVNAARRAMSKAISLLDLSKDMNIHHFDEAFAKYAEGGYNVPNRYTRELTKLMNKARKITPRWYPYTRAATQYIHWGSVNCTLPSPDPLVIGLAASSPTGYGSGSNLLCLDTDPKLERHSLGSGTQVSSINGLLFRSPGGKTGPLFCAHCKLENATTVIIVPAQKKCPSGMKLEYEGFLATGSYAVSSTICIDKDPVSDYAGVYPKEDATANVIDPQWVNCPECKEKEKEKYIPCVVCSR